MGFGDDSLMERIVSDNPAADCAERLAAAASQGGHIALTGGSTPAAAYERAADIAVDWHKACLWFGDERCVLPGDARSNYALARRTLLDRITGSPPRVCRMHAEQGPAEGAAAYAGDLERAFGAGAVPVFDLVLLGLGGDGHCASLFPGQPAIEEAERWVVGVPEAGLEPFVPRVTLTLPVLNAAREVVFLVSGAGKADAVARAFGGGDGDPPVPASLVRPESGRLTVLLDPPAAARLALGASS